MKLKTLKDISGTSYYGCDCEDYDEGCVSCMREHIKQEAIKRLKKKKTITNKDWWEFFNITEDDLK